MRPTLSSVDSSHINNTSSKPDTRLSNEYNDIITLQSSLNFWTSISAECLSTLIKSEQLMEARERIKLEKSEGEDLTTRLKAAKRVTAGFVWKEGTNRLSKSVFEVRKEKQQKRKEPERTKIKKEAMTCRVLKQKADALLSSGKQIEKVSNK